MPKLNKRIVISLEPPYDPRGPATVWTWDSELKGFGVGVGRTGTKSFVIQYRDARRRTRRKVIGRFGVMTVEEARRVARGLLGDVSRGLNPVLAKEEENAGYTIAEICDWYLKRAGAGQIIGRTRRPIKASTLKMDRSRIDSHIRPLLGDRKIEALKLGELERNLARTVMQ